MNYKIRELRDIAGMSQTAFAEKYGIPVSTLRKWEQGESSPAPYLLNLLAASIPGTDFSLQEIYCDNGSCYYYDPYKKTVSDSAGNTIRITEDLNEVKQKNLQLYLKDLFEAFYEIQDKFNRDCRYDKTEDII